MPAYERVGGGEGAGGGEGESGGGGGPGAAAQRGKRRVLHAECVAVADAVARLGEDAALAALVAPRARLLVWGRPSQPCPKCNALLIGLGVRDVLCCDGGGVAARELRLPPPKPALLRLPQCALPLRLALAERGARLEPRRSRLLRAMAPAGAAGGGRGGDAAALQPRDLSAYAEDALVTDAGRMHI